MKFSIDRVNKKDGRTFSAEATYIMIEELYKYLNKVMAKVMQEGFINGEPTDKIEINITWKANGKPVDDGEILNKYPDVIGFSTEALANIIKEKAEEKNNNI